MCDTLVATGEAAVTGTAILAKNSDRHPNEAHVPEALDAMLTWLRHGAACAGVQAGEAQPTIGGALRGWGMALKRNLRTGEAL